MATPSIFYPGNTALITGGGSGIGIALAKKCASAAMNVIVCDINTESISDLTFKNVKTPSIIRAINMDVSKVEDYERVKTVVEQEFGGKIHLLALNAGIGPKGTWTDNAYFHTLLSVNLFGVINGLTTLLPLVTSSSPSSPSAVIITGSKQGITNPPGNPAYNGSKAAVKTLAEHLSFDLAKSAPSTSVHLLIPGWTHTGLTGGGSVKEKPAGAWSPAQVVDFLVQKMGEGKFYVLCPDNEVSEETDRRRVLWAANEVVEGRQPLGRWRGAESKGEAEEWMAKQEV